MKQTDNTNTPFGKAYQSLNIAQRQAVDAVEGPVMVIAGPGTGKTQVLTTRIANILVKTDAKPDNILALTFTDSAAKNMRDRLIKMIGKDAYYVQINTFHAFCSQIISEYGEYFPIAHNSQPLTELEKYELFRGLIEELPLAVLRPVTDKYRYLKDAIANISKLKKEGITPDDFADLAIREKELLDKAVAAKELNKTAANKQMRICQKNIELSLIYGAYEEQLRKSERFDFDDMIMLTIKAFEAEPLLLMEYQEKLQYILVDEYQDTNSSQNAVVDLLASHWGEEANIFVVGDPNQSIFRFQGASLENVLGFKRKYPAAQVVQLAAGYRCSQLIYDAAFHSIAGANAGGKKDQDDDKKVAYADLIDDIVATPARDEKLIEKIEFLEAASDDTELIFIIKKIEELQEKGVPLAEIAILYRNNADSERLMAVLEKFGWAYELEGGSDLLSQEAIRQFLNLLKLINVLETPAANALLWQVLFYDWLGFSRLDVMKLGKICGSKYLKISDVLLKDFANWQTIDSEGLIDEAAFNKFKLFYEQLVNWKAEDQNLVFLNWLENVAKQSKFLDWLLTQENRVFLLNCMTTLFDQVKAINKQDNALKLVDFWRSIETMIDQNLKLNVADLSQKDNSIKLCTVHKAKGREWTYVFMVELVDGKWGNNRSTHNWVFPEGILHNQDLDKAEKNDDERRLFYVGLTRAKKQVFLSAPKQIKQRGRLAEKNMSLFVAELIADRADDFVFKNDADLSQDELAEYLTKILAPAPAGERDKSAEREYFGKLVADFKLSITELNAYLTDKKEFIYQYLLKIPRESANSHFAFGNSIHEALNFLYQPLAVSKNKKVLEVSDIPKLETVYDVFAKKLNGEIMTPLDRGLRLEQGQKVLSEYYEAYFSTLLENEELGQLPHVLALEKSFGKQFKVLMENEQPISQDELNLKLQEMGSLEENQLEIEKINEPIQLYGRIDRIDLIGDIGEQQAAVIDYKTGAPKSMGIIEASAKSVILSEREMLLPDSIKGKYKRQLLFYKLLTDLDRTFPYSAQCGYLDFVEKRDFAKHVIRRIDFDENDLLDMKLLISEVMIEIRSLAFLNEVL